MYPLPQPPLRGMHVCMYVCIQRNVHTSKIEVCMFLEKRTYLENGGTYVPGEHTYLQIMGMYVPGNHTYLRIMEMSVPGKHTYLENRGMYVPGEHTYPQNVGMSVSSFWVLGNIHT